MSIVPGRAADRAGRQAVMESRVVTDTVEYIAMRFAKRRTGGSVYMDGSDNPLPSEIIEARRLVEDLLDAGWQPPQR